MKSVGKRLLAGAILGAAELGAAGLLSNVGKLASFQDITFFLGIFTLLFGGLMLFHTMRVKAGAPTSASNSNAQGAFAAQVAFEEAKAMEKLRDSSKGRELADGACFRKKGRGTLCRAPFLAPYEAFFPV